MGLESPVGDGPACFGSFGFADLALELFADLDETIVELVSAHEEESVVASDMELPEVVFFGGEVCARELAVEMFAKFAAPFFEKVEGGIAVEVEKATVDREGKLAMEDIVGEKFGRSAVHVGEPEKDRPNGMGVAGDEDLEVEEAFALTCGLEECALEIGGPAEMVLEGVGVGLEDEMAGIHVGFALNAPVVRVDGNPKLRVEERPIVQSLRASGGEIAVDGTGGCNETELELGTGIVEHLSPKDLVVFVLDVNHSLYPVETTFGLVAFGCKAEETALLLFGLLYVGGNGHGES